MRQFLLSLLQLSAVIGLLVSVLMWSGCGRPDDFQPKGDLTFSDDSVKFDTIFTTIPSATQRLYIYNKTNHNILINRVYIERGKESNFSMILDGVPGNDQSNIELAKGDSLIAFFTMKANADQGDFNLTDNLYFQVGSNTQRVTMFARVLDAYIFRDTVVRDQDNFKWPTDKPVVVDGYVFVDSLSTLRIPAGAKIYFTARKDSRFNFFSQIFSNGTLIVNEFGGEPVLMTSFRINKDYNEQAGQWKGIRCSRWSKRNYIYKTIIKNCVTGVQVDSFSVDNAPKCVIRDCEIRNCSNFGILGLGSVLTNVPNEVPAIQAYNTTIQNVGQSAVGMFFGGNYQYFHCSFYGDRSITFNRSQPLFGFQNYTQTQSGAIDKAFRGNVVLQNSIIWGTNDEEFALSVAGNQLVGAQISNNILKTKLSADKIPGSNNILNQNPRFKDVASNKYDFRLQANSPARDAGLALNRLQVLGVVQEDLTTDKAGNTRKRDKPDIGALEFKE
jgi:hypothetical protein